MTIWLETINVFCALITICAVMGSVQVPAALPTAAAEPQGTALRLRRPFASGSQGLRWLRPGAAVPARAQAAGCVHTSWGAALLPRTLVNAMHPTSSIAHHFVSCLRVSPPAPARPSHAAADRYGRQQLQDALQPLRTLTSNA